MFIVKVKDVAKEWNGKAIFERVSFDVREGERLALYGRNGVGKTTLLGMMRGEIEADAGSVQRFGAPEAWGVLEQSPNVEAHVTTADYVRWAKPDIASCRKKLLRRERELQEAADQAAMEAAAAQYGSAFEAYDALGGYAWEHEVERALQQVGLGLDVWERPFRALSGGQRTRTGIARLVALRPKVLLLDEPTNHLDRETIEWLQAWVQTYTGTVVIVSHDRSFLDAAAERIVELTPVGAKSYKGNYTAFREQQEIERKAQAALYRKQEQEREQLRESIRMYQQWYLQASRAVAKVEAAVTKPYYAARAKKHTSRYHAKEKQLERLERERVAKPRDAEQLRVAFQASAFDAKRLLQARDVTFRYEGSEHSVLRHVSVGLRREDKLAVIGPNGAGKTTLLRLLIGELEPAEGTISRHPELKVGYFSQQLEHLNRQETILDSLLRVPGMTQAFARTILGCFLFPGDAVFQRIGALSMGELCRAAFLQLYFSGANMLVIDEPTNYLDIDTRERMEQALAHYPGALIVVSHDRYFLRAVANAVLAMDGEGNATYYGDTFVAYEEDGGARRQTAEERERDDAYRLAELERAALMAREQLDEEGRKRLKELTALVSELDETAR